MTINSSASPLLLLIALLLLAGCDRAPSYQALDPGAVVLALGDSITHGTGAARGEDYPSLLAERSGWRVINAGIPGDRADWARKRLPALLEQHQPELVIVEIGGNDFLRKRPEPAVREDIRAIIDLARGAEALVVLVAVPRLSLLRASAGVLADSAIYAELAAETGVILVENILSEVLSNDALRADRIHPNARGYGVFTKGLAGELQRMGLLGN